MSLIHDVLLVHHSHTDIGYTNFQDTVFALHRDYIYRAMDLAEAYADGQPGEQFKWTCETTVVVEDFINHARADGIDRLLKLHRRGLIGIGGMYCNLTPLYTAEMLARTLYVAGRLRRDYGFDIRYALNCDVNGQSWGLVEMLLDAGFEGLAMAINRVMARNPQPRPIGFWWQGPSGRRLLTWHGEHYGAGHYWGIPRILTDRGWKMDLDQARRALDRYIDRLAKQGYPYDFVYFQITSTFMWDNGPPHEELVHFVREWNARGWQPRMRIITLDELFARLRQQPEGTLATRVGEWTDWWAQGVASSAFETALVRQNHGRLFGTQGLAAVLQGLPEPPAYPAAEDHRAWRSLALYDEHTWGSFDSITHPNSVNTRGQWHRKALYAYEGAAAVIRLAQRMQQNLAARLPQPTGETHALVFNPLPWARRMLLLLPSLTRSGWEAAQWERNLELVSPQGPHFAHVDYGIVELPACGYITVPIRCADEQAVSDRPFAPHMPELAPTAAPGLTPLSSVHHYGWTLENRFYRLTVDSVTGAIASLVDKTGGHEWVDATTPWGLGHVVYETVRSPRGRSDMQLAWEDATRPFDPDHDHQPALAPLRQGPEQVLAQRFLVGVGHSRLLLHLRMAGAHDLWVQVVLYDDLPGIDLIYDVNKQSVTEVESLYVAFPFRLNKPMPRYEAAGAIVQAEKEQLINATRDFYAIQNWVDFSNDEQGITVASLDAPMVHLGGFTNHKYLTHMKLEQPLLVGWPLNNHWFTNFCASQSGWMRFRYRLLPHASPFDPVAATRFGAESAVEPLIGPLWHRPAGLERRAPPVSTHLPAQASFLTLEPSHVHLVGLKPAEDGRGIIVRVQELAGRSAEFRLRFPHSRVIAAERCNLLEEPEGSSPPVAVAGNEAHSRIDAYRLQTLRVLLAPDIYT